MATTVHSLQERTLQTLIAIEQRNCCDLKIDNGQRRWWLCRMPYGHTSHRITIEQYDPTACTWHVTNVFTDGEPQ